MCANLDSRVYSKVRPFNFHVLLRAIFYFLYFFSFFNVDNHNLSDMTFESPCLLNYYCMETVRLLEFRQFP